LLDKKTKQWKVGLQKRSMDSCFSRLVDLKLKDIIC